MADSLYFNEHTKTYDIPITHLDFKYINECDNIKELENIMKTLRSGEVGRYAELESCCEKRIRQLNPDSRVLRVPVPLASWAQLEENEREEYMTGVENWLTEMHEINEDGDSENLGITALRHASGRNHSEFETEITEAGVVYDEELPPVRKEMVFPPNNRSAARAWYDDEEFRPKRVGKPRDYSEWDKLEKEWDKELTVEEVSADQPKPMEKGEKMDVSEAEVRGLSTLTIKALAKRVSTLPEHTRRQLAIREKEKGNEAFHANDYDEALLYYKRSLIAFPTTAVYNNRALIYLHQKKWSAAAKDCAHVLQEEPDNLKALFRSGRANYELHNLEQAEKHLERLTDLEPTNSRAQNLLRNVRLEKTKRQTSRLAGGRRMVITDVGQASSDEDEPSEASRSIYDVPKSDPPCSHESSFNVRQNGQMKSEKCVTQDVEVSKETTEAFDKPCANVPRHAESATKPRVRNRTVYPSSQPGPYGREGVIIEELSETEDSGEGSVKSENHRRATGTPGAKMPEVIKSLNENSDLSSSVTNESSPNEIAHSDGNEKVNETSNVEFEQMKQNGNLLLKKGDLEGAMRAYTGCVELASGCPDHLAVAYRNRALVALQMGENGMAVEDCTQALLHEPLNAVAHYRRALGRRSVGDYLGSLEDLEQAHQCRPTSQNILTELLKARELAKNVSGRNKHFQAETVVDDLSDFELVNVPENVNPSSRNSPECSEVQLTDQKHAATDWELVSTPSTDNTSAIRPDITEQSELEATIQYLSEPLGGHIITACTFEIRWTGLRSLGRIQKNKEVIRILHDTRPERLSQVIGIKLDAAMLDEIIQALCWICDRKGEPYSEALEFTSKILHALSQTPRFDCAFFMVQDTTIRAVNIIIAYLEIAKNDSIEPELVQTIKEKYTA
ncbi:Sperm-associated antigen 1 [Paragonimus heterotremus]|uniref:Sperm-associated antigen 1 n=1 Tax=Paragonimus heterotremus TaxID=100268 RepID=A0A8J4TDP5_9TREM|nr:Sperm-associated antigen 1 [Paragonimus heterotremus]